MRPSFLTGFKLNADLCALNLFLGCDSKGRLFKEYLRVADLSILGWFDEPGGLCGEKKKSPGRVRTVSRLGTTRMEF